MRIPFAGHDHGTASPELDEPPTTARAGDTRDNHDVATLLSQGLFRWFSEIGGTEARRWHALYASLDPSGAGIPRKARIVDMASIDDSGYLPTVAHLCEVVSVGDGFLYYPTGGRGDYNGATTYAVGDIVFYATTGKSYRCIAATTGNLPTNASFWVIDMESVAVHSTTSTGLWKRLLWHNSANQNVIRWAVDPANVSGLADDENAGGASTEAAAKLVPLLTIEELDRRLTGVVWQPSMTRVWVHQMSNCTTRSRLHRPRNSTTQAIWLGDLTSTTTATTISGYVTKNDAANTGYQMDLTAAATHVGEMILTTNNKTAWVLGAISTNVAQISIPMFMVGANDQRNGFSGEPGDFVNGETFQCYNLPKLVAWPWAGDTRLPSVTWVELDRSASFDPSPMHPNARFVQCKHRGPTGILGNDSGLGYIGGRLSFSGDLVINSTVTNVGMELINCSANLHCVTLLNATLVVTKSKVRFQEGLMIYGGRITSDDTADLGWVVTGTPTPRTGVFNCTTDGVLGTKGSFRFIDTGTVYGQGNTGHLLKVPYGKQWSLPRSGLTVVTSAPHLLMVAGRDYDIADLPVGGGIVQLWAGGAALMDGTG